MLFHVFPHVYSPRHGQTNPWGQNLMSTERHYHFDHLLQVLKKSLLPLILYTFFHVYIALGQGQTMPWGEDFDPNRKALSLWPFVANLKKIFFNSDFIHIFKIILYMYIAPGQGQTHPWGQNFDINRKALWFWPFVASFNKITLKSDFTHIF